MSDMNDVREAALELRLKSIELGKHHMMQAVLTWALENQSKLHVFDLLPSLVKACEAEMARDERVQEDCP